MKKQSYCFSGSLQDIISGSGIIIIAISEVTFNTPVSIIWWVCLEHCTKNSSLAKKIPNVDSNTHNSQVLSQNSA